MKTFPIALGLVAPARLPATRADITGVMITDAMLSDSCLGVLNGTGSWYLLPESECATRYSQMSTPT